MVKLNKIYTKTGDDGTTGLTDGSRVKKHDLRPEAYGTVDELNSILGIIVSLYENKPLKEESDDEILYLLKRIQNDLFDLGADLSKPFSTNKIQQIVFGERWRTSTWKASDNSKISKHELAPQIMHQHFNE